MADINDLNVTDANNTARFPENQLPSTVNNGARALEGIVARWHKDTNGSLVATGSSNAYAVAANRTISAYYDGLRMAFEANHANTGAATLNVDSVGAKAIRKNGNAALVTGDIISGQKVDVIFDADNDYWQAVSFGGTSSPTTTRGDLIARGASADERKALGADNTLLASDGTDPNWETLSSLLDAIFSNAQGATLYRGASAWAALSPGTNGQFLQSQGAGANVQWASAAAAADLDAVEGNIALLAMQVAAETSLSSGDLVDGFLWAFESDELSTSTNATYDATGDYYHNPGSPTQIAQGTGTNIGNLTAQDGLAAAFDGDTTQTYVQSAARVSVTDAYVGKNYSSAPKRIAKATVYGSTDQGYLHSSSASVTITLYGKNSSAPSNGTDGTSLGSITFNDTSDESTGRDITSNDQSTQWDYVWVYIDIASGSAIHICSELQLFEPGTAANMTLSDAAVTAAASPDTVAVLFAHRAIDSVTMGTDCVVKAKRNAGDGFTTSATPTEEADWGNYKLWRAEVDLSGATAGTAIQFEFTTANNKEQQFRSVALLWS